MVILTNAVAASVATIPLDSSYIARDISLDIQPLIIAPVFFCPSFFFASIGYRRGNTHHNSWSKVSTKQKLDLIQQLEQKWSRMMHVLFWSLLLWNMAVSILLCCQIWGPKTSTEPSCDSRIYCLSLCPVAAGVFFLLETSLWHNNALLVSFFC